MADIVTDKVVGVTFDKRQQTLKLFFDDHGSNAVPVWLRAEPENEHDPNAIAVIAQNDEPVGYLPGAKAKWLKEYWSQQSDEPFPIVLAAMVIKPFGNAWAVRYSAKVAYQLPIPE